MNTPLIKSALSNIKQLPITEINAWLAQLSGKGNSSQFFLQLGQQPASSLLVLSLSTDPDAGLTLHEDFRLHLTLIPSTPLHAGDLTGQSAVFYRLQDGGLVPLHGVIEQAVASRKVSQPGALDIQLCSPLSLLRHQRHNRVFVDRNALDIAHELLRDALGHLCPIKRDASPPPPAPQLVQYEETDYDFIRRILAQEGLFIHFAQGEDTATLYLVNQLSRVPEANTRFKLPYRTNSGMSKDLDHISAVTPLRYQGPSHIHLGDYNPDTGHDLQIHGKHPTGGTAGTQAIWGLNYQTPDQGEALAARLARHQAWRNRQLELVTSTPGLLPGHILEITDHPEYNGSYRVINLTFTGDQSSLHNNGGSGKEFLCRARVLPLDIDYVPALIPRPQLPLALAARITQEVDEQGCYRVRYPFDTQPDQNTASSKATRKLQPFGGSDHGMHFPLARDSEVVITGLNGDLDRPVILGAVFNRNAPDLVNCDNARSNLIFTRGGHTLRMEDQPDQQHILLATPEHKNRLRLDATRDAHQAELASEEGDVAILAGQNLLLQSGSSLFATVGADQQIEIGGNETLLTENGDIQITAGQDLILDAAQDIHWRSEESSINITAATDLQMDAGGQRFDQVRAGDYSLVVEQGSCLLQAAGDIAITSEDGNLTLKNGGGLVQISAEGNLLLEAPEINLLSDNILAAGGALANN